MKQMCKPFGDEPMTNLWHILHNINLYFDSLAHDKGSFILLLMSLIHFPHHFQQRKYLGIAISGPLLEVKGCNLQMSRVGLREWMEKNWYIVQLQIKWSNYNIGKLIVSKYAAESTNN